MGYKKCSFCGEEKPYYRFYKDHSTKKNYKSQCKDCLDRHGFNWRQNKLKERFDAGEEIIKKCECGRYFNHSPKGILQKKPITRCRICANNRPLVEVYVPELKKKVWVRIPKKMWN